jgi:small subunit ribosomal protein S8
MSVTDPIADMLTMIRNAAQAKKRWVVVPSSNIKRAIVEVLAREQYVRSYEFVENEHQGALKIYLKYTPTNDSVIGRIDRVSKPGRRMFVRKDKIPRVLGGLGTAVLSTSAGVLTDKEARAKGLGGEWLCNVS